MTEVPSPIVDCQCLLGESPSWSTAEQALYWVDIKAHRLHCFRPATGERRQWELPWLASSVAPADDGRLVLATAAGVGLFDPAAGAFEVIAELDTDRPGNRPNEGKCDRHGRFWVGTMDDAEVAVSGRLYRFDPDRTVHCLVGDVGISNTLAWTADDRTLYFADTMASTIYAYEHDPDTGEVRNPRHFADTHGMPGGPDGSCIDADDFLWNCQWDGARIARYAPDGRLDRVVPMPVPRPTSCCFGGPDLDTLYITSARIGLDDRALGAAPDSGSLFAFRPGVRGVSEVPFRTRQRGENA